MHAYTPQGKSNPATAGPETALLAVFARSRRLGGLR